MRAVPLTIPYLFQLKSLRFAGRPIHLHAVYMLAKAHPSRIDLTQIRELSVRLRA